jgi:hypothetical protein
MGRIGRTVAAVAAASLLAGCDTAPADRSGPPDRPLAVAWTAVDLPPQPGPPGRAVVRDAVACAGRWFLVGAVAGAGDDTRPAAWASPDGRVFTPVPVRGDSAYGRRNVLYSAGCRDGRLAAVGAKPGGAHGNPRVSSWRTDEAGRLVEVAAPFELYGGPSAVNVARVVGGDPGWLVVGNRTAGAAVWTSPDAARFAIVQGAAGLASDAAGGTWATDAVAVGSSWVVVGAVTTPGRTGRDPMVSVSADGRSWTRRPVPGADGYEEAQRVGVVGGAPVAVGLRGARFGAWRDGGAGWAPAGVFGSTDGPGPPTVSALATVGDRLVVSTSDGAGYRLWVSADSGGVWRPVGDPPTPLPGGPDTAVAVAGGAGRMLVAADDGRAVRVWSTDLSGV